MDKLSHIFSIIRTFLTSFFLELSSHTVLGLVNQQQGSVLRRPRHLQAADAQRAHCRVPEERHQEGGQWRAWR